MASGAMTPGGLKIPGPGGLQELRPGGHDSNNWRVLQGHVNVDAFGSQNASGARVLQTRGVRNARKDAKTTGVTYLWTLPTVPGGSTTAVTSLTGTTTQTSTYLPDVAGAYVLRCVVTFTGSGKTQTVNFNYTSA